MKENNKVFKKIGSILWGAFELLIIVYVICITMCILCRNKFGFTQFDRNTLVTIQEDTYKYIDDTDEGDLLVIRRSRVEVGDHIYYYIIVGDKYAVKEGVVKEITDGETASLYLLEDGVSVTSTKFAGNSMKIYHNWGSVLDLLMSRFGFLFLVLLPIMIVFIYQIYEFIMVLKYEEVEKEKATKKKKVVQKEEIKNKDDDDNVIELL